MGVGSIITVAIFVLSGCSDDFGGSGKFNSDNTANAKKAEPQKNNFQQDATPAQPVDTFADGKDYGPYEFGKGEPEKKLFDGSGIVGIETQLVNISFEDGSDNDYNDVSFCFEGLFKVDNKSVVYVDPDPKDVKITVKRLSGNYAIYTLKVFDENNVETYSKIAHLATMGQTEILNVSLTPGSKIQTRYDKAGDFHDLPGSRSRVIIDKCMNTGS